MAYSSRRTVNNSVTMKMINQNQGTAMSLVAFLSAGALQLPRRFPLHGRLSRESAGRDRPHQQIATIWKIGKARVKPDRQGVAIPAVEPNN